MPYIKIKDKNLYYREYGEGDVLVFLNGMMMSTTSWSPFIKFFSSEYKILLVDLIDQGRSDKADTFYTQDMHVEMLKDIFEKLGYHKVHLIGTSYGGEIAQLFTLKYKDMVRSLILSNTTSYTDEYIKKVEKEWYQLAEAHDDNLFLNTVISSVYSENFYKENIKWIEGNKKQIKRILDKEWYKSFMRGIISTYDFNVNNQLNQIRIPTLVISSDLDTVIPMKYQQIIYEKIPLSRWIVIKDSGHASIYEKPYEFMLVILGFLKTMDFKLNK
ncbi:alpha/beta hydrolase [Anaerosalibacter massiliensis]|uniref:Alpha/beta hydrolase n=1 Tax=Anaerosalibacter massiliensis TaxID=1347392 RepID=A0A9X2S5C1_9FIRM|nr:alpha/beta hydrolase [Anaerosalibacter massiliensis]MCR2044398.1 alpha/beta hydrolase [Anaerosalibacter massiliensis]